MVVKKGGDATRSVRLLQKATRKPVTDAEVTQARVDMAGMAGMASPVKALPASELGLCVHDRPFDGRALARQRRGESLLAGARIRTWDCWKNPRCSLTTIRRKLAPARVIATAAAP
jgi:hypothetical protein